MRRRTRIVGQCLAPRAAPRAGACTSAKLCCTTTPTARAAHHALWSEAFERLLEERVRLVARFARAVFFFVNAMQASLHAQRRRRRHQSESPLRCAMLQRNAPYASERRWRMWKYFVVFAAKRR